MSLRSQDEDIISTSMKPRLAMPYSRFLDFYLNRRWSLRIVQRFLLTFPSLVPLPLLMDGCLA